MQDHYFISDCDGALHDTRDVDWSRKPLRSNYSRTHRNIATVADLKATLRAGKYAWPGGYPMFFIAADGTALSFEAVREEFRQCVNGWNDRPVSGWRIVACDINYEEPDLLCDHTGQRIESAYAD